MGLTSGMTTCLYGLLLLVTVTSGQARTWIKRPQDVSARPGDDVTFECQLNLTATGNGTTSANVIWEKDSVGTIALNKVPWVNPDRLSIINSNDLVIKDIRKEDDGEYSCKSRDAGVQTARLTVLLYPGTPTIDISKVTTPYKEGTQVTLTCSSSGGNPSPRFVWLKNGNLSTVQPTEIPAPQVGGLASSSMTLTLDRSDHQANFSCLVHNELNTNSKLMAFTVLNVQYAPTIGFRPYSPIYHVRKGSNVVLECDVDANPTVSRVTWHRDSIELPGTSTVRNITDVQVSNGGTYNCTAVNSVGTHTDSLKLDVQYPPILSTPRTQAVNEGEDISIECEFESNPSPYEVQWQRISSTGATSRTVTNAAMLTLTSVGREKAGNYSCIARSRLTISGESVRLVSSESFTYLYVQYKPGKAQIGSVPDIYVGENLVLTCTATPSGYPEAVYIWLKDGVTLSTTSQTYRKSSVTLEDNGRYSCTPSNKRGTGDKTSIYVNVYEPPSIVQRPKTETVVRLSHSNSISLTCVAQGYPEPQITWYQNGESLKPDLFTVAKTTRPEGKHRVRVESVLQFLGNARAESSRGDNTMLKISDMGNYTCQAESSKHTDTSTAVSGVIINFPPILVHTPTRYARTRTDRVELVCEAQGNPVPAFQWFFKGSNLEPGKQDTSIKYIPDLQAGRASSRLDVGVSDKTYGVYLCVVSNTLGNQSREITLSHKTSPERVQNLTVAATSWESIMLSWQPGFDGGYQQRFYINRTWRGVTAKQMMVLPLSATSFNVTKLHPNTNYTFLVMAANQLGPGLFSTPVLATTKDLFIPKLSDVPVFNVKQRKLLVVSPSGNEYCLRIEVRTRNTWKPLNECMKVMGDTLDIIRPDVTAVNVSICLSHRTDVCGQPAMAEIHSADKDPVLTEIHVVIIACICAVIIVSLLIVLFCFICRRRRNAAKANQAGNTGDPPPYQAVSPSKKPQQPHHHHSQQQGYDNQGMDTTDQAMTQISHAPSAPSPESDHNYHQQHHHHQHHHQQHHPHHSPRGDSTTNNLNLNLNNLNTLPVHAHANPSFTNSSYGPLEFYPGSVDQHHHHNHHNDDSNNSSPGGRGGGGADDGDVSWAPPRSPGGRQQQQQQQQQQRHLHQHHQQESPEQLSPRSLQLVDRHQFDNEMNWNRENNNRMDQYANRDLSPVSGNVPHSPNKDKYIDLQDRGGGGMDANDQGYAPSAEQGGGKPKKVIYEVVV